MHTIRDYQPSDEASWLRCRLLTFFGTDYYDDIVLARPTFERPAIRLVTHADEMIIGLIDVEVFDEAATINCIAIHPDQQRSGLGTVLLQGAIERLPADVRTLDAWTREDVVANRWYRARGFTEGQRYLHVYKGAEDPGAGFAVPAGLTGPITAFMQAPIAEEERLRAIYKRVYVCRQYIKTLRQAQGTSAFDRLRARSGRVSSGGARLRVVAGCSSPAATRTTAPWRRPR